jgi:insulysin
MDVGMGHYGDPNNAPGLAHFLEHMLFLGTKKYPKEDAYDSYLSTYGGSANAYTDNENTNFFFDVHATHLEGALDRFSQFFIAPLLSESATGREMKAVDAEHSKNKQNDEWRESQLMQGFAYPDHPMHKFGTGNLKTLSAVPQEQLREMYRQLHASHHTCFV